jgi:GNAT superfamily N-acetyltransferase
MGYNQGMEITINRSDSSKVFRAGLDSLMRKTFGISLAPWFRAGGWTKDYACYSMLEAGQVIANVSLYRMDLLVNGRAEQWLQLGGVAVRPERRGEGLSRQLLEFVLSRHPETPDFVCGNETVLDFYPRFGFRRVPSIGLRLTDDRVLRPIGSAPGSMVRRDAHDPRVRGILEARTQYSRVLDCTNGAPIVLFHLLNQYSACLYELPALGALVIARQEDGVLHLPGVWAERPLSFAALASALDFRGVREVRFGFTPDWLGLDAEPLALENDPIFVRGDRELPGLLPELLRT